MAIAFWTLALFGHGFLWVEIVNRLHGLGWQRKLIDRITQFCGLAVAGIPLVAAATMLTNEPPRMLRIGLHGYAWLSLTALVLTFLGRVWLRLDPHRDRRTKLTRSTTLDLQQALGPAATRSARLHRLATLPGNQLLRVELEELSPPIDRLPEALEGFKIAHLTDLHMSGRLTIDYFKRVVQAVNEWGPDLVCITGDIIEHTPQLDWIETTLGELCPAIGTYYVLGNHDAKIDATVTRERLTAAGLIDVSGRALGVEHRGTVLTLCGDERPWFRAVPPLSGEEAFTLCLAHTPDRFGWAHARGIDLVLAGHCHGGQVCFPLLGPLLCPSKHGVRYAAGTFRRGHTVLHTGRGTGSLFPLRYNCPPEVALLTLSRG